LLAASLVVYFGLLDCYAIGLVWFGLVWFGLVRFGLVWFGLSYYSFVDAFQSVHPQYEGFTLFMPWTHSYLTSHLSSLIITPPRLTDADRQRHEIFDPFQGSAKGCRRRERAR
jgi:hypothetical protein